MAIYTRGKRSSPKPLHSIVLHLLKASFAISFRLSSEVGSRTAITRIRARKTGVTDSPAPEGFSNLNNGDWVRISNERREANPNTVITHPKRLPFFCGVKFLVASSRGQAHIYQNKLREKYGDAFIIWDKYVTINDASAIRDVLETYNLPKPAEVLRGYDFFFGAGSILSAPWEEWKSQRRMTSAALAESTIGSLAPRLVQGIIPLMDLLEQAAVADKVVEMDEAFQATATDIIGLVIFGKSFGLGKDLRTQLLDEGKRGQERDELDVFRAIQLLKRESQRQMVLPRRILKILGPSKRVLNAKSFMDNFLENLIEERLHMDAAERSEIVDLLNILLGSHETGTITRDEVKGQLLTFIFAGQDTTAHTLSWMLYELSQNYALQEELASEIKDAFPNRDGMFTATNVLRDERLSKLDRTFSETLRKYPAAATGTLRVVGNASVLVGDSFLELPAGASISIPPYALHRNPKYWTNPECFDPDRFLPKLVKSRDPMTFQAFSAGPRNCIGSRLSRIEALTIMAALLRRFRVTCVETKLPPKQYAALTMGPKDGIRFSFEARK
ncbi:hypothetical protein ACHAWF_008505 [Thalassiosira exigua]